MLLQSITITGFRSFGEENNVLQVNPGITTIVGMNESGKSNLIDALSHIDLVKGAVRLNGNRNRILNKPISLAIKLIPSRFDHVDIVGDGATVIVLSEDGGYSITGSIADIFKSKHDAFNLAGFIRGVRYENANDRNTILTTISNIDNFNNTPLNSSMDQIAYLKKHLNTKTGIEDRDAALSYIDSLETFVAGVIEAMPALFYHSNKKELKSSYLIAEIRTLDKENKDICLDQKPDDLFLSLIDIATIPRDDVVSAIKNSSLPSRETFEKRANRMLEERIMKGFREFYKKESESIEMTFRIDGSSLAIHVSSGDGTMSLSERSNGLRWYLKMYIDLIQSTVHNHSVVFLLDEPGIHLHINAQDELRNMLIKQASSGSQIVYSTHSPYMIDPNFACIRSITKTQNEEFSCIHNSLYGIDYQSTHSLDTLSPIAAALGMDIRLTPGLSPDKLNVIVEGLTDQIYLQTMAKNLGYDDRGFSIIPSTGADNIKHLCSIMLGWGFRFVALFDYDNKGYQCCNELEQKLGLEYQRGFMMIKPITNEEYKSQNRPCNNDARIIESLISDDDKKGIGINEQDTEGNKKSAAVLFASALNSGYQLSEETTGNFKSLFERILLICNSHT